MPDDAERGGQAGSESRALDDVDSSPTSSGRTEVLKKSDTLGKHFDQKVSSRIIRSMWRPSASLSENKQTQKSPYSTSQTAI